MSSRRSRSGGSSSSTTCSRWKRSRRNAPAPHRLLEVAVRRGDEPDVHRRVRCRPPARTAAPGWRGGASPAPRAAARRPRRGTASPRRRARTGLRAARGAGERPPLVPEELALEERLRERRAVHRHERALRARAVVVERARDHLLARAALAPEEHRRAARRDARDDVEHRAPARRSPRRPRGTAPGRAARAARPRARAVGSSSRCSRSRAASIAATIASTRRSRRRRTARPPSAAPRSAPRGSPAPRGAGPQEARGSSRWSRQLPVRLRNGGSSARSGTATGMPVRNTRPTIPSPGRSRPRIRSASRISGAASMNTSPVTGSKSDTVPFSSPSCDRSTSSAEVNAFDEIRRDRRGPARCRAAPRPRARAGFHPADTSNGSATVAGAPGLAGAGPRPRRARDRTPGPRRSAAGELRDRRAGAAREPDFLQPLQPPALGDRVAPLRRAPPASSCRASGRRTGSSSSCSPRSTIPTSARAGSTTGCTCASSSTTGRSRRPRARAGACATATSGSCAAGGWTPRPSRARC